MPIRVITRHGDGFDIYSATIDPAKSPYANCVANYTQKILDFYSQLGVTSAQWTATWEPEFIEADKHFEYLLELTEDRVIAYVDEQSWSSFLFGKTNSFEYSRTPMQYEYTSVLVTPPIRREEAKELRRYSRTNTGHCKLEERKCGIELQCWLGSNCQIRRST
jgi:hypothetical protein